MRRLKGRTCGSRAVSVRLVAGFGALIHATPAAAAFRWQLHSSTRPGSRKGQQGFGRVQGSRAEGSGGFGCGFGGDDSSSRGNLPRHGPWHAETAFATSRTASLGSLAALGSATPCPSSCCCSQMPGYSSSRASSVARCEHTGQICGPQEAREGVAWSGVGGFGLIG